MVQKKTTLIIRRLGGILIALSATGILQPATAQTTKLDTATYLQSYWYNGVDLLKAPFHFSKEQWITTGGTVLFAGAMITLDEPINLAMQRWTSDGAQRFGEIGAVVGGAPFQLGISGGAMLVGAASKNKGLINFGLDNLQAQAFTGGVTLIVKNLFHRARPYSGEGAYSWYGPFNGWGNDSYYSGHTALAFSTATMIFLHSKKKWWVGVLSFGAATAVGLSRMQQQKHWASDVVMGAVMGTVISGWVYKKQEQRRAAKKQVKLAFH